MVVRRGNAPRSLAYRASALLLSYGTVFVAAIMMDGVKLIAVAAWFHAATALFQSKNATWAIVRLWVSVFIRTRCQNGSVMVAWSL
jgi:hypothetical protein